MSFRNVGSHRTKQSYIPEDGNIHDIEVNHYILNLNAYNEITSSEMKRVILNYVTTFRNIPCTSWGIPAFSLRASYTIPNVTEKISHFTNNLTITHIHPDVIDFSCMLISVVTQWNIPLVTKWRNRLVHLLCFILHVNSQKKSLLLCSNHVSFSWYCY